VGLYAPIPWEGGEPRLLRREAVLASLATRLREEVQEAASGFEAVVTQAGPAVRLEEPVLGDAATLGFTIDSPQQVTCFPGENGMQFQIWREDFEQILARVAELVSAVLEGAYSEPVKNERNSAQQRYAPYRRAA
jgi:hypothetical protein